MLHKCPMRKGNVDILNASTRCPVAILPLTHNQTENVLKVKWKLIRLSRNACISHILFINGSVCLADKKLFGN